MHSEPWIGTYGHNQPQQYKPEGALHSHSAADENVSWWHIDSGRTMTLKCWQERIPEGTLSLWYTLTVSSIHAESCSCFPYGIYWHRTVTLLHLSLQYICSMLRQSKMTVLCKSNLLSNSIQSIYISYGHCNFLSSYFKEPTNKQCKHNYSNLMVRSHLVNITHCQATTCRKYHTLQEWWVSVPVVNVGCVWWSLGSHGGALPWDLAQWHPHHQLLQCRWIPTR